MMQVEQERYLSTQEAAGTALVTVHTLRRWVKEGKLTARRVPGTRKLLIPASELYRLLDQPPVQARPVENNPLESGQ